MKDERGLARAHRWNRAGVSTRGVARETRPGTGGPAWGLAPLLALALAFVLGGCGNDDEPDPVDDASWRTSTDPVATGGLAWATGSTVTLGDGTTIETGDPVRAFVVAGDGVFFVPGEDEDDSLQFSQAPLYFAAPGTEPVDTGLEVAYDALATSPEGDTLVVLEADYDTGEAAMRFFDLADGTAYTSTVGMESDPEDPVHHLLEAEVQIWGTTEDEVHVAALEGDFVYDLATGEGRPAGEDEDRPGWGTDPLESPDGQWSVKSPPTAPDRVVGRDGQEVALAVDEPRWWLSWWADEETVVGSVVTGPGSGKRMAPGDRSTLLSCVVPSGACTTFPESTGRRVLLPVGASDFVAIDLGGVDG